MILKTKILKLYRKNKHTETTNIFMDDFQAKDNVKYSIEDILHLDKSDTERSVYTLIGDA